MDIGRWSYETGAGPIYSRAASVAALLVSLPRKHQRPYDRKHEDGNSEDERDYTHPALLELCRRVGEEKHRGEQNSIREVLTGNTPGTAGLLLAVSSFCGSVGSFSRPSHLIQVRHKRMRIGVWIFKRLFRQPCIVSLAHFGRKTFHVKLRQLLIARLFRGQHFRKHCSVNRGLLHSLQTQNTRPALERVKFIHQPIALPCPRR